MHDILTSAQLAALEVGCCEVLRALSGLPDDSLKKYAVDGSVRAVGHTCSKDSQHLVVGDWRKPSRAKWLEKLIFPSAAHGLRLPISLIRVQEHEGNRTLPSYRFPQKPKTEGEMSS
jgi:hypothetical protein